MRFTRRTAFLWGGFLAVFGTGWYEIRPSIRALETDPEGTEFEYRDGVITRVTS